jgi:cytochrome P450
MLNRSGAEHARLRASVSAAFGRSRVKQMRPLMQTTVSALLDEWAPKGTFDFVEFAANFPIRIMFALIGASTGAAARNCVIARDTWLKLQHGSREDDHHRSGLPVVVELCR